MANDRFTVVGTIMTGRPLFDRDAGEMRHNMLIHSDGNYAELRSVISPLCLSQTGEQIPRNLFLKEISSFSMTELGVDISFTT